MKTKMMRLLKVSLVEEHQSRKRRHQMVKKKKKNRKNKNKKKKKMPNTMKNSMIQKTKTK
jgi:hypothetical protein